MDNKLPPCTCGNNTPEGWLCGLCHSGMSVPKSYFPELTKALDNMALTKNMQNEGKTFTVPDIAERARLARSKP